MAATLYACHLVMPVISDGLTLSDRLALLPLYALVTIGNALVFFVAFRIFGGLEPSDRGQLAQMKLPFKRFIMRVL